MINKYIKYNGLNTKELGLRLVDDIELESPSNSIDFIEIDGVDGAKIKDNQRLTVVDMSFPFMLYLNKDIKTVSRKLQETLLNSEVSWKDLELSWDNEYIYKAIFYENFKIKGSLNSLKKCILNFKVHPIKYLKNGQASQRITSGTTLRNPESRQAKPLIKLIGTGDVTLTINTQIFKLKGVSGHINIDCETQSAHYDNKEPQYDKVFTYPFPHLDVGNNKISWNNNNFIVEITPRWEALT